MSAAAKKQAAKPSIRRTGQAQPDQPPVQAQVPIIIMPKWNGYNEYMNTLNSKIAIITTKWPTIASIPALPESGDSGFQKLVGIGSPFNPSVYTDRQALGTSYACHSNVFLQDLNDSVVPYLPLYWERVMDYVGSKLATPTAA